MDEAPEKCPAAMNHRLPRYHLLILQSSFYLSGKAVSGPIFATMIEILSATCRGKIFLVKNQGEGTVPRGKIILGSFHMASVMGTPEIIIYCKLKILCIEALFNLKLYQSL